MKVLGLSGSLRAASYNTALLRAAQELAPEGMTIDIAAIGDFPLYNGDVEAQGMPAPVERVAGQIRAADAVLFAMPEYNFSISGVLKNAIDWLSRCKPQPFADKPCAIMGASAGMLGTARAQYHLRQVCVFLDLRPLGKPEVFVGLASGKFDDAGYLADATTRKLVADQLAALAAWTARLAG